jgi:FdhE protein
MAAVPLLQACARALQSEVPLAWWEGYCPVCGAWPALAELRGLERKRWLRCGRCSAGWELPLLRCPFCGEMHHDNLGYLAPEESQQTRRVEVCKTCSGYLKAEATVRALAPWAVLLDDLATLPLDVAALERGYARPTRPGYALEARMVEDGGGWWRLVNGWRRRDGAASTALHRPPPPSTDLHEGAT